MQLLWNNGKSWIIESATTVRNLQYSCFKVLEETLCVVHSTWAKDFVATARYVNVESARQESSRVLVAYESVLHRFWSLNDGLHGVDKV